MRTLKPLIIVRAAKVLVTRLMKAVYAQPTYTDRELAGDRGRIMTHHAGRYLDGKRLRYIEAKAPSPTFFIFYKVTTVGIGIE